MFHSAAAFRLAATTVAVLAFAALPFPSLADTAPTDPATLWQRVGASTLEPDLAVEVKNLAFDTGMARLKIEQGLLFPASTVGERSVEMVFQGRARLTLEAPDEVEAGQMELFTGRRNLDEIITEAALVITVDAAVDALLGRPLARGVTDAQRTRAGQIFDNWRQRSERRVLRVDNAIFRDALADPMIEGYFAGWFRGEELGEFLYVVEPNAPEQVKLGRFTKIETTKKEERQINRELHRAQRKGRLIGFSADDLGTWDTWLSTSRRRADGSRMAGTSAFEPRHYEIDLSLEGSDLELNGRTRLHLEPLTDFARIIKLELSSDLSVRSVSLDGEAVFHLQSSSAQIGSPLAEVLVVLPQAPAQGQELVLEVAYGGQLIDRVMSKAFALGDTVYWHPHAGTVDRATYDMTFHWPQKFELLTGGTLVDRGTEAGGRKWQRRKLEQPTLGYSFEIGRFQTHTAKAGDVRVNLAVDVSLNKIESKARNELLLETITDSLEYFEDIFGPYPLDEITVVTAPRAFSQSFFGFMTLSSLAMADDDLFALLLGLEDRRTVVAHEIAHQWWGHMVPWKSYRDQWISEAMANYAAVLYARQRLGRRSNFAGPTSQWETILTAKLEDGRTIESLGPLVLGERLVSSLSVDAYQAIVYKKGAVVVDMLARAYGEEQFINILRTLIEAVSYRPISTEDFIALIENITRGQIDGFAQQFIYGTGLPEVYYSYAFEQVDDKWQVQGVARQHSPYRYEYRVVERNGSFDVARQRLDQTELSDSTLFVPVQIAVYRPDGGQSANDKKRGIDPRIAGNAMINGRLVVTGENSEFQFLLDYEPKELWLDRGGQVFGRFFNESRHPKRMLLFQAQNSASAGDHAEAEDLYRRALASDVFSGPNYDPSQGGDYLEGDGRWLDAWIRLWLGRLYLDQGRVAEARQTFGQLEKSLKGSMRRSFKSPLWYFEARIAIQEGDFERGL